MPPNRSYGYHYKVKKASSMMESTIERAINELDDQGYDLYSVEMGGYNNSIVLVIGRKEDDWRVTP